MCLRTPSELGGRDGKFCFLPCHLCHAMCVQAVCAGTRFVGLTEGVHMYGKEGTDLCGLCKGCSSGWLN